jgi:group I intron endonuclease
MEQIIYKLTSPTGKIYVGRTHNFEDRMVQHKYEAITRRKNYPLYKAIRKYGWDTFNKEIIAMTSTEENAQVLEEAFIVKYNAVKKGYNATYTGGGGNLWNGKPEEQKQKFREKMSQCVLGDKNGMYGKTHSDEAKEKQRQKAKGRFSLEWYIDRYGEEEGTILYNQRCDNLSNRKLNRNERGVFISSL